MIYRHILNWSLICIYVEDFLPTFVSYVYHACIKETLYLVSTPPRGHPRPGLADLFVIVLCIWFRNIYLYIVFVFDSKLLKAYLFEFVFQRMLNIYICICLKNCNWSPFWLPSLKLSIFSKLMHTPYFALDTAIYVTSMSHNSTGH